MRTARLVSALLVVGLLAGCQWAPREIDGRRVTGIRWVNGQRVYVLAPTTDDAALMKRGAQEASDATKDVVFEPTQP